jgi:hypothetical protein
MTCAPRRLARALGGVVWPVGLLLIGAAGLLELPPLTATGFAVVVVGVALFLPCNRHPDHAPYTVQPPVRGRWIAVKSPAQKLPSHGTHELARASAIDLVHVPDPSVARRRVRWWPPARPACRYPAYGQPVLAPGDGIVVAATGWQRDHWSRDTPWTLAYLFVELLVRAVLSPFGGRFVLGNRVIVDLGDGVYAVLAHLRRGSVRVRVGQRVRAGEVLAACGNSGYTSEPRVHFQLVDHRRPALSAGVPFEFDHFLVDDEPLIGVPANREPFIVPAPAAELTHPADSAAATARPPRP